MLQQKVAGVDRGLKVFGIVEPAHFLVQFGFGDQRGRHFLGAHGNQVNLVVSRDGLLVFGKRAVFCQVAFEHRPQTDGARELVASFGAIVGSGR